MVQNDIDRFTKKFADAEKFTAENGSKQNVYKGRGGGQVVSMLAFYSNDLSSNPAEAYSFFCKICVWKERK